MQCHQKYSKGWWLVDNKSSLARGFYFSNVLRSRFLWLFIVVKVMHKFKVSEWLAYLILICVSCCFIIHRVAYFLFYIFSSDSRWNIDFLTLQIITWCMTAAKTYQHLSGFELTVCDSRSIFIISQNTFFFFSWNSGINF